MTPDEARERVRQAQARVSPPGGFDAWLHILAAPAGSGAATKGGSGGDGTAGEVWSETVSLTAPNDPGDPLSLFFIPPERVARVLAQRLACLGESCARAGDECAGYAVQAGLSGMEYRALAPAPPGFVPRYRLPRRSLDEPIWAGEPLWCPRERLSGEPGRIAAELVAGLAARLEGSS
ncbi:MAG TPA: hypothetical protein VIK92_03575 [Thermaerobacter sp.]